MSVRGKRKEKVTYEPIPIVGVGIVEAKEIPVKVNTKPSGGGLKVDDTVYPTVSLDTVPDIDHTIIVERVAGQYEAPNVVTVNTRPLIHGETEVFETTPTNVAVINVIPVATEPLDETVDNLPKVFGRKLKDPVTVK